MAEARIKVVGASGQITLGRDYAGRAVLVREPAPGVWVIKVARVMAESEPAPDEALVKALAWAAANPASDLDFGRVWGRLNDPA
jgi:hypothetical protein